MHRGYTLNYFIKYFQSIPNHQWCTGSNQKENTVQHCALGHALRDARTTLDNSTRENDTRVDALNNFLDNHTAGINDDVTNSYGLGRTPRGRILRALRNRKRYGKFYGKNGKSTY